jgi:DNA-directed RNA polymerase specialized sigma24 family protein
MNALLERLQGIVYNLAARFYFEPADAEDATQDILLKVVDKLHSFKGESKIETWAYRVANNHLLNAKRGSYEGLTVHAGVEWLDEGLHQPAYHGADAPLLEREVKWGCTISLLVCLSRPLRMAYLVCEILEFDGPEAAFILEVPPATVRKRLELARKTVRQFFQSQCGITNPSNSCRCAKQITANLTDGWLDAQKPRFSSQLPTTETTQRGLAEVETLIHEVAVYQSIPAFEPPQHLLQRVRDALASGDFLTITS